MAPVLPLELQLYILKVKLPPGTSIAGHRRRNRLLRTFALVHRTLTPIAQRLLFTPLILVLANGGNNCARANVLLDVASPKVGEVRSVLVNGELLARPDWAPIQVVFDRCPTLEKLELELGRGWKRLGAVDWPVHLRDLTIALTGPDIPLPLQCNFSVTLPANLTRLSLAKVAHLGTLPVIPTLRTFIVDAMSTDLPLDVLFPSLRILACGRLEHFDPAPFCPHLPSTLRHLRIGFGQEYNDTGVLQVLDKVPSTLLSLHLHLSASVQTPSRDLQAITPDRISGVKVRYFAQEEDAGEVEVWEADRM
ncbi:hypothetical protein JCM6882_005209 [Rhodosporidiobolus microsporus]